MIQRKQTVYLLLSLVALVLCTLLPVGHFEAEGMGVTKTFYNLSIMQEGTSLLNIVMTVLLALSGTIHGMAFMLSSGLLQHRQRPYSIQTLLAVCLSFRLFSHCWHEPE